MRTRADGSTRQTGPKGPSGIRVSSVNIDYKLLYSLIEDKRLKTRNFNEKLIDRCYRKNFTIQRVYLTKSDPRIGTKFIDKLMKAGIDVQQAIKK